MKLILTQEVAGLGDAGDIVEVKDGYGRNYLLPRGLAIGWTRGGEKQVTQIKRARKSREIRNLDHAKEVKAEIEALTVNVPAKAGDSGKLFGSVTNTDVMNAIKAAGGPLVEKRNVQISAPIKKTGSHTVAIDLHPDVVARVTIEVVPS
ncbi:MAG: 50S ribosomal protein L9 [Candidatus Nanopelagicales bacterium]|jgi:large subunit ribosomal protein L9|nr:50S ribosomal protein L9 [Acidimicrobiaceae bacterium]MBL6631520.1 50S ribosomal protein L9 [Candidatus Nanopelagicales bacterium]MBM02997.1 50S ribosomal protein L9 [Micrococcales bacterium]MBR24541.1 50S ribosomal protein L9 [Rubrivirga sp.]MCH9679218.1 50S ribosomal protein L9 [Actinomycetes bacterium]MCP4743311.1 50S ribosomal protein L9 [Actinomycetales bacterium]NDA12449.1 50S ribosomal protein L9 [Actinomycetota bacterium]RZP29083.1 MAG: 50S ribosomal protein L9 [Acidimicrobiales b|tara:strand:- start:4444 stop:4890 length:447 start_codon:yes stop_codon:yes gene_type:complete